MPTTIANGSNAHAPRLPRMGGVICRAPPASRPPGHRHRRPHGRALPDPRPVPRARGPVARPSRRCSGCSRPTAAPDRRWHDQTPEERAATRTPRGPWWSSPAGQTIDLATALFPALLYERLDELGIDFGVVYPSLGLVFLHTDDDALPPGDVPGPQPVQRRDCSRRSPTGSRPWPRSRCTRPRRRSPSSTTRSTTLGFKAVLCAGYVQRPFAALAGRDPEVSRVRVLARPVRHRLGLRLRPGVGPGARSSACRSPSTRASSG